MNKKRVLSVGIFFVLSSLPSLAQTYVNSGFQYQSPSPLVGGPSTQLSIPPVLSPGPGLPVVWVYGSYLWGQANGANFWPYSTYFDATANGYASLSSLSANSPGVATTSTVTQLILDQSGTPYWSTSEYVRHQTPEGGVVTNLLGHYLHAMGQVLTLANAPVHLALDSTANPAKIFVLESDPNNHAAVERFDLLSNGVWIGYGSVPLAANAGAPVDLGIVSGSVVVLGSVAVPGSGGSVTVLTQNLGVSLGPDYTPNRSDGGFVTLKGFARDEMDAVAVGSGSFYIYGDVLSLSKTSTSRVSYYVAKHGLASAGFAEGNYPPVIIWTQPPSDSSAVRRFHPKTAGVSSVGNSAGAVRLSRGGSLYVTGTASPNGSGSVPTTVPFDQTTLTAGRPLTHSYPAAAGIAMDTSGVIYVGLGGSIGSGNYALAFQAFDPSDWSSRGSGQWVKPQNMGPTSIALRRYTAHPADVFLGGSLMSPDSTHMYTGVVTQFSAIP